ncbi:MAG: long-subunit fatty acid transport protein [Cryomorphaceae bacterium]
MDDGEYVMGFDQNELIETTQIAERDGRLSETALTIGANYDDRLYLGFGLGFQDITYASVIETRERPVGTPAGDLLEYTLIERLQSEGLGVNARLGVIYKLDNLRFGASVRTPTVFSMTDNFTVDITSRLQNPTGTFNPQSDADFFEYRIRTPWHFMGSVAGVIGKKAILSAQYERINFSGGELRNSTSSAETDFSGVNNFISQSYSASDIFRVGGEYRITKSFSARGGFAYFANPITVNEQQTDENLNRQEISFGLGYRVAAWYVDMSYSRATFNELYDYTDLNRATLENTQSVFGLTVGIRM